MLKIGEHLKVMQDMSKFKCSILVFITFLLYSCTPTINGIKLSVGDTQTYETKEYLIIYEITGTNNFGQPIWKFKKIINKTDTICTETQKEKR